MTDAIEREHCEQAAAEYLKFERLPPYDETWHLATTYMRERAAVRAECQAEIERLEARVADLEVAARDAQALIGELGGGVLPSLDAALIPSAEADAQHYEVVLPSGLQCLTDEQAAIVVAITLSERAAAFTAGDKAGYERGRAELRPAIENYQQVLRNTERALDENRSRASEAYRELSSKYTTLEAAAQTMLLASDRVTSDANCKIRHYDILQPAEHILRVALAALTPEPKP